MRKEQKLYCNCCGKELEKGLPKGAENYCHVEQRWGYFSEKDLETHSFDLCEDCYDSMTGRFLFPIQVIQQLEI